jgi:hypothetical protein
MEKFSPLYLKMCKKAKNIFLHPINIEDWFYHPILNDEEVKVRQVEKILGSDVLTSDPIEHYPRGECIWLPTVKEIKKMAENINVYEDKLEEFLNDDKGYWGYPIGMKPRNIFKILEEQWLAYYMAEISQIWEQEKQDWKKIGN